MEQGGVSACGAVFQKTRSGRNVCFRLAWCAQAWAGQAGECGRRCVCRSCSCCCWRLTFRILQHRAAKSVNKPTSMPVAQRHVSCHWSQWLMRTAIGERRTAACGAARLRLTLNLNSSSNWLSISCRSIVVLNSEEKKTDAPPHVHICSAPIHRQASMLKGRAEALEAAVRSRLREPRARSVRSPSGWLGLRCTATHDG